MTLRMGKVPKSQQVPKRSVEAFLSYVTAVYPSLLYLLIYAQVCVLVISYVMVFFSVERKEWECILPSPG